MPGSSRPARCSARRWRPSRCSRFWAWARATAPFQEEGGGPALLVVSTFYFVGVIAAALWGFWRAGAGERAADDGLGARDAGAGADAQAQSVQARCEALADEAGLTPREREILGYLGRGHGIAFVAATLVISESTVRTHVKSIYKKLGVNGREGAAREGGRGIGPGLRGARAASR